VTSFSTDTEYVYGIEGVNALTISGTGKLSIEINTSSNSIKRYLGIEASNYLGVDKCNIDVAMRGNGSNYGIYTGWKGFALTGNASVKVASNGGSSRAVYDSSYMRSTIEEGCSLEMMSEGGAFQFSRLTESLTEGEVLVNTAATADGAKAWDKNADPALTDYKYVKFTGNLGRAFGKDVRILGTKIDDTNCSDVLGDGTVKYDTNTDTLTLTNAQLDLAKFHHEYDDSNDPDSGCNFVAGIKADKDIRIVLKGRNRIYSTAASYSAKREYIYGIDVGIMCNLEIDGPGSLEIAFDKSSDKLQYDGIDFSSDLTVKGAAVTIDLGGRSEGDGIDGYMADSFSLQDNATIISKVSGAGSKALSFMFANKLSIGDGSMLELTADGKAFNYAMLSDAVTEKGALVNTAASAADATAWDKTTRLTTYRYVRFPENYTHTHAIIHVAEKAAGCTEAGYKEYWTCSGCGKMFSDENGSTEISSPTVIPALGHKYGDWIPANEDQHQRVCSRDKTHIEYADHAWDSGKVQKIATLLRKGEKIYTCTVCGERKIVEFTIKDEAKTTLEKIRDFLKKIFHRDDGDDADSSTDAITTDADRAGKYKVFVLGTQVTDANKDNVLGDPAKSVTFVPGESGGTLILDNAVIDLADYKIPDKNNNYVAGIDAWDPVEIRLVGNNVIRSTASSFASVMEYGFGITANSQTVISGSGTLDIDLYTGGTKNIAFNGIESAKKLIIDGCSLTVNMTGGGKCDGMDLWTTAELKNGAKVTVHAEGQDSYAVNGSSAVGNSVISSDSTFEMISDGHAFNCFNPSDGLKELGAMVNTSATAEGATAWNKTTWLTRYKYIRFPADESEEITPEPELEDNPLAAKGRTANVSYKKLRKSSQKLGVSRVIRSTSKGKGTLTYAKLSGNNKITINKKTGTVTVKKKLAKGTYKVRVRVSAAGNDEFKPAEETVTFRIKVK
ncbi:MAG: cadherin repeat domain-containing protein, partial [Mogibacterium sp.]|nr:cadherin repeat domain-containing protein [Mogibacterium sp.]